MKNTKIVATLFVALIVGSVVGVTVSNDSQPSHGVGLTVAAEKDLKALEKKSDLIVAAHVDGNYEITKMLEDKQNDVYQINRVYIATIKNSFKDGSSPE